MGPAVLITLGLLFLLANTSHWPFERTWPILLIVIGGVKVLRYVLTDSGHFNPGQYPAPPYGAPYQQAPVPPVASQAVEQNGTAANGASVIPPSPDAENGEVHNG
jgi:hypothetical protein